MYKLKTQQTTCLCNWDDDINTSPVFNVFFTTLSSFISVFNVESNYYIYWTTESVRIQGPLLEYFHLMQIYSSTSLHLRGKYCPFLLYCIWLLVTLYGFPDLLMLNVLWYHHAGGKVLYLISNVLRTDYQNVFFFFFISSLIT